MWYSGSKDPSDLGTKLERLKIPGLVGMNILKDCREIVSCHLGLWATKQPVELKEGYAKVLAPSDVVVPAGCMCLVPATGPQCNTACSFG